MQHAREVVGVETSPQSAELLDALGFVPEDQAARLLSGIGGADRPTEWTPLLVKERLRTAAETMERMERRAGPKAYGASWVDYLLFKNMDAFDRNARHQGLVEGTRGPDRRSRSGASSADIRRAEQALEWPMRYLADREDERRVLSTWLWCEATDRPWSHFCKEFGGRGSASRKRDRGFSIIAAGLKADRREPE